MRKAVVSGLVMFILSSGCLFAQVSFGIKAGAGMSSYSGSDWEDYLSVNGTDNRFGFLASAGGFINYKFNKSFALQLETLFSTVSGGWSGTLGTVELFSAYREMGVEVPLYLQYGFPAGPGRVLFTGGALILINLGPVFETGTNDYEEEYDVSDYYSSVVSAGMALGLGYELGHWQILVLYKRGLKPRKTNWLGETEVFSQNFAVELGYKF